MLNYRVLQIGLGPLGQSIAAQIASHAHFQTVAGVDLNPELAGKQFNVFNKDLKAPIYASIDEAIAQHKVDVAMVTTVSSLEKAAPTFLHLFNKKIPVVSSCEELSYPWLTHPDLSAQLDDAAKHNHVAILGTCLLYTSDAADE